MALDAEKYEICVIKPSKPENKTDQLQLAFDALANHDLDPLWVSEEYCLQLKKKELKLFVMDPFEGNVFSHLKSLHCRIMGPLCVLTCLHLNEALPRRPHPIYSVAMRGLTITCSNLEKSAREKLSTQVQLMSGNFSKDLTKSVTHLIVGDVGSKKYHVAVNLEIPVMLPEWIEEIWTTVQYNQVRVSSTCCDEKFKCPIFKGLCITISQVGTEERSALKLRIEQNGGRYLGALKSKETTHLVLLEASGDKYNFAKSWKLPCVRIDWLYDSLKCGYCKDHNLYKLDDTAPKRSTPIKDGDVSNFSVDCSAINVLSSVTHLDETTKTDSTIFFKNKFNSSLNEIDEFDISSLPKLGQFLDGCKIYLFGFKGHHLDKLRKIVNFGGATRFNSYSDSVSHVVCRAKDEQLFDMIKRNGSKPHVVTFQWLLDCGKSQKNVDEGPYCFPELSSELVEELPEETISNVGNTTVVHNDTMKHSDFESSNKNNTFLKKDESVPGDFSESLLKQYSIVSNEKQTKDSSANFDNSISNLESVKNDVKSASSNKNVNLSRKQEDMDIQPEITINDKNTLQNKYKSTADEEKCTPNKDNCDVLQKISSKDANEDIPMKDINFDGDEKQSNLFKGKTFKVVGFGDDEVELLSNMITLNAGAVFNDQPNVKADVAVVPLTWEKHGINATKVITNCWLQKCIEENTILAFNDNELFTPISVSCTKQPLKNCVISISQYVGTERDCLMHLAELLGALCQDYFVRKANSSRGLLPNTHLVISTAEGSKYEAAKKWNIPAVTKNWLLAAAKLDAVPPEEDFSVDLEFTTTSDLTNSKPSIRNSSDLFSTTVHVPEPSTPFILKDQPANVESVPSEKKTEDVKIVHPEKRRHSEDHDDVFIAPNNRIAELIDSDRKFSPKRLRSSASSRGSYDFENFAPKFDISGMLADLDSSPEVSNLKSNLKNKSLPLEEKVTLNLRSALNRAGYRISSGGSPIANQENNKETEKIKEPNVLENVILSVSKKLNKLQSELNKIVTSLGGQFRWTYDQSCTHFVFQGKLNDASKEFKEVKRHGKKIISPEWVYACQETNSHVDEESFPHTFKPRLSLMEQVLTSKSAKAEDKSPNPTENCASSSPKNKENLPKLSLKKNNQTKTLTNDNETDTSTDLDDLMVAVKSAKTGKRRCRLNTNSSSPSEKRKTSSQIAASYSNIYNNCEFKSNVQSKETVVPTETPATQSVPITWDDPTGRKEREIIAAEIADPKNDPADESDFTLSKQTSVSDDFSSQFLSLRSEKSNIIRKFMLSSYSESDKAKFSTIISELGGILVENRFFDDTATHLIMGQPLRNEKFLASVASGKWIIHHSYLTDSASSKCFLPEDAYEWGSSFTSSFILNSSASSSKVAMCPRRWRLKLSKQGKNCGAFHNWKVVIIAENEMKRETYMRILKAGGAEVFDISCFKLSKKLKLTHAFVELGRNTDNLHYLKILVSRNVNCIKPNYLADYLMDDPPPSIENFILPEVKEISMESFSDSSMKSENEESSNR